MSADGGVTSYGALADRVRRGPARLGGRRLVCVDGPSGAGKTTLALGLARALGGMPVVHLDDVYDGWDGPLGLPLAERVRGWLLLPWRDGLAGRHPRYDWAAGAYVAWREVPPADVLVLEGVGSAQAGLRADAALTCWVDAPEEVRRRRTRDRDGAALAAPLVRWREREAAHFAADGTRAAADLLLDGTAAW